MQAQRATFREPDGNTTGVDKTRVVLLFLYTAVSLFLEKPLEDN